MEVIVDRIEEDFLVLELEGEKHVNVPKMLIPNAREGDIIDMNINYEKRAKRESEINNLKSKLFIECEEDKDEKR